MQLTAFREPKSKKTDPKQTQIWPKYKTNTDPKTAKTNSYCFVVQVYMFQDFGG